MGSAPPTAGSFRFPRFQAFATATGADAEEEDCLRTLLTIGRRDAERRDLPDPLAPVQARTALQPDDLVEVRAELALQPTRREVLWTRVRWTGKPERPWLTHDWRRLHLGRAEPCRAAPRS